MREPRQNPVAAFMEDKDKVTVGVSVLGAFITVIGLVFLAVQAFSRGWLGPGAAVSGAAVLCLLLIAGSFVVHTRSTDGPTAPALMCVGVLGMFTDLWVLVFGLEWLSPGVGVVLVGAIFAAGLLTAWSWSHQVLAVTLLVAGCGFLTPAVIYLLDVTATSRFESLSLVVLGLLGAATTWHRDWRGAAVASAAVFLLGSLVLNVDGKHIALAASAAVGIVVMAWLSRSEPAQTPGISAVTRWVPVSLVPVLLLLSNEQSDLGMTATTVACLVLAGAGTAFAGAGAVASSVSLRPGPGEDGPSAAAALRAPLCCGVAGIVAVSLVRQQDLYASPSLWWMIALVAVATTAALQADQLPVSLVWVVFLVTVAYSLPRVAPAWVETSASPILMWPYCFCWRCRGCSSCGALRPSVQRGRPH